MNIALLLARGLLAVVFAVAGFAKLADRAGSRQALVDFGIPIRLANPGGILLPLTELIVAMALLPLASAWWGALGALVLVLLFIAAIVFNLTRGRVPDCHCFGQLHSEPIGRATLVRNGMLAAIAAFVVWEGRTVPGLSAVGWLSALTISERIGLAVGVLVFALLAVQGWLLSHVLQQNGRLLLRVEALERNRTGVADASEVVQNQPSPAFGLPVGTLAPAFSLPSLSGEVLTLDALRAAGRPVVLLFVDPGCGPCTALLPEVSRWQREYAGKLTVALISRGTAEANRLKVAEHRITQMLLQRDLEVYQAFQSNGTPSAVLVRTDGTVGSPLARGAEAIRALVAGAIGLPMLGPLPVAAVNGNGLGRENIPRNTHASGGLKVGEPVPTIALPDLTGRTVNLTDFRGKNTLLLFWNPGCSFCQRMLTDLKAWEAEPLEGTPQLLVISTGTVEANQTLGLRSLIVLDQGFTVGKIFGASGTPTAVLIDAEGKLASRPAIGASAVLALAGYAGQVGSR